MKKKLIVTGSTIGFALLPMLTFAYADAFTALYTVALFIQRAIPVLVAAAILFLIFNIITYVVSGDAEKKEQAKGYMVMVFIALAFFAMIWGLIRVLANTFNIQVGQDITTQGSNSGNANDFIPIVQ